MKRKIVVTLSCDSDDPLECLKKDIQAEISCCSTFFEVEDVRPAVRGKWMPDYDYAEYDFDGSTPLLEPRVFQDGWQCGFCGQYMPSKTNFCPKCGADMRQEKEEEP